MGVIFILILLVKSGPADIAFVQMSIRYPAKAYPEPVTQVNKMIQRGFFRVKDAFLV
jgi:hypothetical protein